MARAALDLVRRKAAKKPISYTFFEAQADSVAFQLQIAEASRCLKPHRSRRPAPGTNNLTGVPAPPARRPGTSAMAG